MTNRDAMGRVQVVGTSFGSAWRWRRDADGSRHAELNTLIGSDSRDWNLEEAHDINDSGMIVGVGSKGSPLT